MDIVKSLTFWKNSSRNYVGILEEKYSLSTCLIIDVVKSFLIDKSKVFIDGKYAYKNLGGLIIMVFSHLYLKIIIG